MHKFYLNLQLSALFYPSVRLKFQTFDRLDALGCLSLLTTLLTATRNAMDLSLLTMVRKAST